PRARPNRSHTMSSRPLDDLLQPVAGNGLLHRRLFLTQGASLLGAAGLTILAPRHAGAAPPDVPAWMKVPGPPASAYGARSKHEEHVQRMPNGLPGAPGAGGSRTPHEHLEGIITPSALHFERHHSGVPDIDPDEY